MRVVIIGGGFAGIEAARALKNSLAQVLLIDTKNHHCFQPLLYQVATAELSPADIAWPIRRILRNQRNARVVMAEVTGVDRANKQVVAGAHREPYDILVIASGATHFYFGHDDWEQHAPGLKRIEDATRIRAKVLAAFEQAEIETDATQRERLMSFVIIGGGPTGVEMAGSIADIARYSLRGDFRAIDPGQSKIYLLEAGPRILPAFSAEQSLYAQKKLESLGVTVNVNAAVTACESGGVRIGGQEIAAATIIWAAGVKASPAAQWLDAPHDRNGRLIVNDDLTVQSFSDVYAVGDVAAARNADGKPIPGIAPAAKQMGQFVGRKIAGELAGRPRSKTFTYRHAGDLATIGRRNAIVQISGLQLKGVIGWIFWSVIHIYFLITPRSRLFVALNWMWGFVSSQRSARLIS